jgi:hypothetical protein
MILCHFVEVHHLFMGRLSLLTGSLSLLPLISYGPAESGSNSISGIVKPLDNLWPKLQYRISDTLMERLGLTFPFRESYVLLSCNVFSIAVTEAMENSVLLIYTVFSIAVTEVMEKSVLLIYNVFSIAVTEVMEKSVLLIYNVFP